MLRLHTATSAYAVKKYFEGADYYADEAVGRYIGKLADEWGLTGPVDKASFDKLCDNIHPLTGKPLTPRTNDTRRVGDDMIFSLPKDVGAYIMLLPLEERERYLAMVERRVEQVMGVIEADVETRVRRDGAFENRPGDGLIIAGFRHTTSRPVDGQPPDPHPHWHMFAMNATRDRAEGGRIKAADFGNIYRDRPYYEALFFSLVAEDFAREGLSLEHRAGGKWGLAGLESVSATFSKRTNEIEEEARRLGITDPGRKAELGAKTRARKEHELSPEELREAWFAQLSDDQRDALSAVYRRNAPAGRLITAEEAVAHAVRHCFERESVVAERELVRVALLYGLGQVTAEEVRAELPAHGVMSGEKDGRLMVTTEEVHRQERFLTAFAQAGRGVVNPVGVAEGLERGILDDDQWNAVTGLLASCDRVSVVDSAAGVGKSTMLGVFDQGMTLAGRNVTYLATTTPAVGVLRQDGFDAETVAKFLLSEKMQTAAAGGTVVVDESSMLGLRDAYRLFSLAKEKNLRLVLLGDSRQHASVAAGAVMRVLQQYGGITPYRITQVKRQKNKDHREAVEKLFAGRTLEGFDLLDKKLGWVHEIADSEQRYAGDGAGICRCRQGRHEVERNPAAVADACRRQAGGGPCPAAAAGRGPARQGGSQLYAVGEQRPDRSRAGRQPQLPARHGGHGPVPPEGQGAQCRVADRGRRGRRGIAAARPGGQVPGVPQGQREFRRGRHPSLHRQRHDARRPPDPQRLGLQDRGLHRQGDQAGKRLAGVQGFRALEARHRDLARLAVENVSLAIVGQSSQSFGASNMEQAYVSASRSKIPGQHLHRRQGGVAAGDSAVVAQDGGPRSGQASGATGPGGGRGNGAQPVPAVAGPAAEAAGPAGA